MEFHETVVKLALFCQYFCQNLTRSEVDKNFFKLLSTCYFCILLLKNFDKFLSKFRKKLQTKKVDKILSNVCKFCFNVWLTMNCAKLLSVI